MKLKKQTQTQRIAALEKTVFQLWTLNKMIQDELKSIQDKLNNNINNNKDEEE
jgi:uncharacterized coiled-coil protein SlyX